MAAERKQIDWEAVERDYRAGILTHRQMAAKHAVSHTAIQKRADKEEWPRDLRAKILAKAEQKVAKAIVAKSVANEKVATDKQAIEAGAEAIVSIVLKHRKSVSKAGTIVDGLFAEVEALGEGDVRTAILGLAEQLADGDPQAASKLRSILGFSGRVDAVAKLVTALKTQVSLEREIFGVSEQKPDNDIGAFLASIAD